MKHAKPNGWEFMSGMWEWHGVASRIKPPNHVWEYTCGETPMLYDRPVYCHKCQWLEPDERPKDCKNIVKVDLGPKY